MSSKFKIDIFSDVVCPWCIIGYQSLNAALDKSGLADQVELNWRPFELNPDMPIEGKSYIDYGRDKYGRSPEQAVASLNHVVKSAASVGFEINFPDEPRIYNTFNAHRLLHWARESGLQTALKLAFFNLFFQEQGSFSDEEDLLNCAEKVGLNRERAAEILQSNDYSDAVKTELNVARQNGISSVPTYIFDNKYLVTGGQPVNTFIEVLNRVIEKKS